MVNGVGLRSVLWIIRKIKNQFRLAVGGRRALRKSLWIVQHVFSYLKIKTARYLWRLSRISIGNGPNNTIRVSLYGHRIWVRPLSPDYGVSIGMFDKEFDALIGLFSRNFNGLIIDAGGYIGTAAIQLSEMYPQATVVTIEPHPENFCLLEKNISGYSNIIAIKAAIISETEKEINVINIYDRSTGQWGFTIIDDAKNKTKIVGTANTITLSDICNYFHTTKIDIMKIDIEGSEKNLFESNDKHLANASFVFVELHERFVKGCNMAFKNFSKDRKVIKFGEKYLVYPKTSTS